MEIQAADQLVGKKLIQLRLLPSGLCSDEEFLRRITIDITGQLPTEQDYHQFMSDVAPDKRVMFSPPLLAEFQVRIRGDKQSEVRCSSGR